MSLENIEQRTEGIKKQAQELIEHVYQRGYTAGKEESKLSIEQAAALIEQGRNEAWEATKKIYLAVSKGGLSGDTIVSLFGAVTCNEVITNFSASEAIEKIKAYEEKKQEEDNIIHIGDEVVMKEHIPSEINGKAIVIAIDGCSKCGCNVMNANGDTDWIDRDEIDRKTGRHFPEIKELMKKLQEG